MEDEAQLSLEHSFMNQVNGGLNPKERRHICLKTKSVSFCKESRITNDVSMLAGDLPIG